MGLRNRVGDIGDRAIALRELEQAEQLKPDNENALRIADSYIRLGEKARALNFLRRAELLHPDPENRERIKALAK